MMADYGKIYLMTDEERKEAFGNLVEGKRYGMDYVAAGLAAFSAAYRNDLDLARRAWETLTQASPCAHNLQGFVNQTYDYRQDGQEKQDIPWIATNYVAQWCLNVIMALEFIRDSLPPQTEWDDRAVKPHAIPK